MMKKLIVMGIAAVMVMGLASMVSAGVVDALWTVQFRASDANNGSAMTPGQFGIDSAAATTLLGSNPGNFAEIYCTDAGGATPRWYKDMRVGAVADGASMTWNLVLTAGAAYTGSSIKLTGWNPTGTRYDLDAGSNITVKLMQGDTTIFTFDPALNGTSAAPTYSTLVPYAGSPINLTLVASAGQTPATPEPGSIIAMLSGLVGLVGYGIRRRK